MTENPSIEPAVRLPRQVSARADRARLLLQPPAPPAAEPPSANADAPAPAQGATASPPPDDVPRDPRENDPNYWRQRFNVTKGMWQQEREKMRQEVANRDATIAQLQAEVAHLKQQSTTPAQVDLSKYLSAEEIETLGEDQARTLVAMSERLVADRVRAQFEAQPAALKPKAPATAEPGEKSNAEKFLDGLDEDVPTWRDINEEPEWLAFLRERDDQSGIVRQRIVDMAQADGDHAPVVKLLRQFIAKMNPTATEPRPPVVPQGTAAGMSSASPAASVQAAGVPTQTEIREHYKLRKLGKVQPEQAKAFDARVKAAQDAGLL